MDAGKAETGRRQLPLPVSIARVLFRQSPEDGQGFIESHLCRRQVALGLQHAVHIPCENQVPLGNVMRAITEKMGVTTDDRFYGGAFNGTIKELN